MVRQLRDGQALAAHGSMADGGIRVPFDLYHLTVFDMGDNTATPMATPASGPLFFYFSHFSTPLNVSFIFGSSWFTHRP
jgi:hypothetical protein